LEAICLGVPVIYFDAPGGTKDIVTDGHNGFCIRNEDKFEDVVNKSLTLVWNRKLISKNAKEKFDYEKIMALYHQLFLPLH
jgi:glycosyltransferase involved in cell wall biosynthesis